MVSYSEITALKKFISDHNVRIQFHDGSSILQDLIPLSVRIADHKFIVYVQDEYEDLKAKKLTINTVLVLRELELIEDSTDYLNWCQLQDINATTEALRSYYQDITKNIHRLYDCFDDNKITSFISDLDYQLSAGAMQWLLKNHNT